MGKGVNRSILLLQGPGKLHHAKHFVVRPEVIVRGREFAHIHPDGSLHASLPPQRAQEAVKTGWAIWHPWAKEREGWEGFVMLYTPLSMEELEVTFQLVVDSYNFVTGQEIQAIDVITDP